MKKFVCSKCGKEYELPEFENENDVSELIIRQKELNLCDKCYVKYINEKEEQK